MTYHINTQRALSALAEPARQEIYERLASRPQAVGELAAHMPISRPAVSQHLKILKEAGLVTETPQGTRRIYRLDPRGLAAMREWLDHMWFRSINDFKSFVENAEPTENKEKEK